jgi:hypothetical protein
MHRETGCSSGRHVPWSAARDRGAPSRNQARRRSPLCHRQAPDNSGPPPEAHGPHRRTPLRRHLRGQSRTPEASDRKKPCRDQAINHLEPELSQRGRHVGGVILAISQISGMLIGRVTDHERHALLRMCNGHSHHYHRLTVDQCCTGEDRSLPVQYPSTSSSHALAWAHIPLIWCDAGLFAQYVLLLDLVAALCTFHVSCPR